MEKSIHYQPGNRQARCTVTIIYCAFTTIVIMFMLTGATDIPRMLEAHMVATAACIVSEKIVRTGMDGMLQ